MLAKSDLQAFYGQREVVLEIWKFHSFVSRQIPQPETESQQILRAVNELKEEARSIS